MERYWAECSHPDVLSFIDSRQGPTSAKPLKHPHAEASGPQNRQGGMASVNSGCRSQGDGPRVKEKNGERVTVSGGQGGRK